MRRRVVVGLAAVLAAAAPPAAAAGAAAPAGLRQSVLTLVTGDVVRLTTLPDGRQTATPLEPRPGVSYRITTSRGHVSVLPSDAGPLLAAADLAVTRDTALTLDARRAKPVTVRADRDPAAPVVQTSYLSAGTWLPNVTKGDFFASFGFGGEQDEAPVTYRAGRTYTDDWHAAVIGPRLSAPCPPARPAGRPRRRGARCRRGRRRRGSSRRRRPAGGCAG